jgi:hypothetical protein
MVTTLSQASALNPGSNLWVVSDLMSSKWTAKIDWYLNFQIIKAARHKPAPLPEFLVEAVRQTGIEVPKIDTSTSDPLLILSEPLLPNKWVLVIPFEKSLEAWVKSTAHIWSQLQRPSLRLFLPAGQNARSLHESWLTPLENEEITVVLDLSN